MKASAPENTGLKKWSGPVLTQWSASLYVAAVSLGISVLLARLMGPADFGAYYYLLNLASLLAVLQDGGFRTLLLREQAAPTAALRQLAPDLPGVALTHLLVVSALIIALAAALWWTNAAAGLPWAVGCFGIITLTQWVSSRLKGAGEFVREALWQAAGRTVSALLVVAVAVFAEPSAGAVFAAWGAGLLLVLWWFPTRQCLRPPLRFNGVVTRAAFGFLWIDLATRIYSRADIVILNRLLGPVPEIGVYAASYRLYDGVLLLAAPIALMFFRELRTQRDDSAARKLGTRTFALALALGALLAVAGWLLGPFAVGLLYGERYAAESAVLVGWLFSAFVFVLPNYVLTQIAIATHDERRYALCASGAAAINILLNFTLIPDHGTKGAAWAVLATEAFLCAALLAGTPRRSMRASSQQTRAATYK